MELASFLNLYPWPETAVGEKLDFLWEFSLGVPPKAVWPLLTDTSRVNRAIGWPEMHFSERGGDLYVDSVVGGMAQAWREVPWDWNYCKDMICVRDYSRGIAKMMRGILRLEETDGGRSTHVTIYFGWLPRGGIGRRVLAESFPQYQPRYEKVLRGIEDHVKLQRDAGLFAAKPSEILDERLGRLDALTQSLVERGVDRDLAHRIRDHISRADDLELHRIRVIPLARRWAVPERELINAFLHATRVGMTTMSWDVICPHCRGVREELGSLGRVGPKGRCDVCNIDFENDREMSLEITFRVHASIKEVPPRMYCSAEPAMKMHIKVQQAVEPGQTRTVETILDPGRYRLRVKGSTHYSVLDIGSGAPRFSWGSADSPNERLFTASSRPVIEFANQSDQALTFVIEDARWQGDALRPGHLFNVQGFRDLFAEEYIATDMHINVGEQAILFTDIVGSTSLYENEGDARAFMEVRRHFREIFEVIDQCGGAVIKTMGDGTMSSFHTAADALRAAVALHKRFGPDRMARLRAAVNVGPCIAVNLNSGIDYFGQTVNQASKIQPSAGSGQTAVTEAVLRADGVQSIIELENLNAGEVSTRNGQAWILA